MPQGTAPDPDALACLEKRMRVARKLFSYQSSNRVDLVIGNRRPYSLRADQPQHAIRPKYPLTLLIAGHQLDE